jgi:hypothetical protein
MQPMTYSVYGRQAARASLLTTHAFDRHSRTVSEVRVTSPSWFSTSAGYEALRDVP